MGWKLPRKRKKAFIAKYGRERYQRAVLVARCFEPTICFDVNAKGATFVVAGLQKNGTVHILGMERTMDQSKALFEFMRTMPKRQYRLLSDPPPTPSYYPEVRESKWQEVLRKLPDLNRQLEQQRSPLPLQPKRHGSPLYRKVMDLVQQAQSYKFMEDHVRASEVGAEIARMIEQEAVRDSNSTSFILVDRKRVNIKDHLLVDVWFKYGNRIVAMEDLPDGVRVRTMLFTCDPMVGPDIFETIVQGGEHDGYSCRYATWEAAEEGHRKTIEMIFEA